MAPAECPIAWGKVVGTMDVVGYADSVPKENRAQRRASVVAHRNAVKKNVDWTPTDAHAATVEARGNARMACVCVSPIAKVGSVAMTAVAEAVDVVPLRSRAWTGHVRWATRAEDVRMGLPARKGADAKGRPHPVVQM